MPRPQQTMPRRICPLVFIRTQCRDCRESHLFRRRVLTDERIKSEAEYAHAEPLLAYCLGLLFGCAAQRGVSSVQVSCPRNCNSVNHQHPSCLIICLPAHSDTPHCDIISLAHVAACVKLVISLLHTPSPLNCLVWYLTNLFSCFIWWLQLPPASLSSCTVLLAILVSRPALPTQRNVSSISF